MSLFLCFCFQWRNPKQRSKHLTLNKLQQLYLVWMHFVVLKRHLKHRNRHCIFSVPACRVSSHYMFWAASLHSQSLQLWCSLCTDQLTCRNVVHTLNTNSTTAFSAMFTKRVKGSITLCHSTTSVLATTSEIQVSHRSLKCLWIWGKKSILEVFVNNRHGPLKVLESIMCKNKEWSFFDFFFFLTLLSAFVSCSSLPSQRHSWNVFIHCSLTLFFIVVYYCKAWWSVL